VPDVFVGEREAIVEVHPIFRKGLVTSTPKEVWSQVVNNW